MKAERRHELQENSLVRGVRNFPQFWKDYGSKISLVIILFLLALVLVRYWLSSREVTRQVVAQNLTAARTLFEQYRQGGVPMALLDDDPKMRPLVAMLAQRSDGTIPLAFIGGDSDGNIRGRVKDRVDAAVAEALRSSSDPARQAEATLLRADLSLHLGTLAQIEAATVPATPPATKAFDKTPEQYLESASKDYGELIAQAGKIPAQTATAARFGLAAVHENQGQFDKARELYDQIRKDGPNETTKQLASVRIDLLLRYTPNPLIGQPTRPKADPATTQAATGPATTQATQPATTPAASDPAATAPAATAPAATQPASAPAN